MIAQQVVPGVYSIPIGPVNAYLIDAHDDLTLIDTGLPDRGAKVILQALQELGKKPEDIGHVLVTHCHADHSGGLAALKTATRSQAYMHPADAQLVREGKATRPTFTAGPGLFNQIFFRLVVARAGNIGIEPAAIEHEVLDGDELAASGRIQAVHIPGHCAGQLAFLWPEQGGVLFAADAAGHMMGNLGWSIGYEDLAEGKRSLAKLASLDFQVACFGHGTPILHNAAQEFHKKWGQQLTQQTTAQH